MRRRKREEAAPTFSTWRRKLEKAGKSDLERNVRQFVDVLRSVGSPMIDEPAVDFVYHDPAARSVAVTGEFSEWDRDGTPMRPIRKTGVFHHRLELRGPARMEYKLIVDGEWRLDPLCPESVDNGLGSRNSVFHVGDVAEPPELEERTGVPRGTIVELELRSEILKNRRPVHVYRPAGYEEDTARRFPTLYVHDGGEYLSRAKLPTVLDNLIAEGVLRPLIAVMVDPVDRMREYWNDPSYARFVMEELVPHVDDHHRTLPVAQERAVMGASLGGLISTYLALSRPDVFARLAGQSSAFFADEERIIDLAERLDVPLRGYFDVGTYEPRFVPAHARLLSILDAKGCRCRYQEVRAGHNWTSWRAHLKDLLTWIWEPGT
ncbi:MAG: hypothetical protein QOD06_1040 [Candidatus Binatota bacterium]|nr:hypothetical protein [Candidatus Binatota bacterium]